MVQWYCTFSRYQKISHQTIFMVWWSLAFSSNQKKHFQLSTWSNGPLHSWDIWRFYIKLCMVWWSLTFSSNYKIAFSTFYMVQWSCKFLRCQKIFSLNLLLDSLPYTFINLIELYSFHDFCIKNVHFVSSVICISYFNNFSLCTKTVVQVLISWLPIMIV
jgi:hypothetical protein